MDIKNTKIYLLTIYDKSKQDNISKEEIQYLKKNKRTWLNKLHKDSCERCFDKTKPILSLYPNPVKAGEVIKVRFSLPPNGYVNFVSVEMMRHCEGGAWKQSRVLSTNFLHTDNTDVTDAHRFFYLRKSV